MRPRPLCPPVSRSFGAFPFESYLEALGSGEKRAARNSVGTASWVRELVSSLDFKVGVQYRFLQANHMNIKEHRVYRTLVKLLAKSYPGCRVSYFATSRFWCHVDECSAA